MTTGVERWDGFDAFYRAEAPAVHRALAVALGDADVAADATAEAMARACARWDRVGAYDQPTGWVYRVGLNWARSRWRKVRRERPLDERPAGTVAGPEPGPDVAAALARLSADARAVVVCRVLLDLDTAATAAALGIPTGTAKSRLSRALAALREDLAYEEVDQ